MISSCAVSKAGVSGPHINIKTDFGAVGNGITNDHDAFVLAAQYINQRKGNCTLIIPKGTYKVGKQVKIPGEKFRTGIHLLDLKNCTNVKIICQGQIRYKDGLYYGSFNPKTSQAHHTNRKEKFRNRKYLADVGSAISLRNCENIELDGIDLDGNNRNIILGGDYVEKGIQARYSGITMYNVRNVKVMNCKTNYFGQDGFIIKNYVKRNPTQVDENILVQNCTSDYNGRQGMSVTGCIGLTIVSSSFSHTGRGGNSSGPGAGIDFEGEGQINKNITLTNCQIIDNRGVGLLADSGNTSDVEVDNCFIWGTTKWSVWMRKPRVQIKNSTIYGAVVHAYSSPNNADATKFINCSFRDTIPSYGKFLVQVDGPKNVQYINCDFHSKTKRLFYTVSKATAQKDYILFESCDFYPNLKAANQAKRIGVWGGVRYKNNTFHYNKEKSSVPKDNIRKMRTIKNLGGNSSKYNAIE